MTINIRTRLVLALVALVLPLGLATYFLVDVYQRQIDFSASEIKGMQLLRPIQTLTFALARSSGDIGLIASVDRGADGGSLRRLGQETKEAWQSLSSLHYLAGESASDMEASLSFWLRLPQAMDEQQFEALAATLDATSSQITDRSNLILDPDLDSYYMMAMYTDFIPSMRSVLVNLKRSTTSSKHPFYQELISATQRQNIMRAIDRALTHDAAFYGPVAGLTQTLQTLSKEVFDSIDQLVDPQVLGQDTLVRRLSDLVLVKLENLQKAGGELLVTMLNARIDSFRTQFIIALIITGAGLLLGAVLALFTLLRLRSGLRQMQEGFNLLAQRDFSKTVPISVRDEFGKSLEEFNSASTTLKGKITNLRNNFDQLNRISSEVRGVSLSIAQNDEQNTKAVDSIAQTVTELDEVVHAVENVVERNKQSFASLNGSIEQANGAGQDLNSTILKWEDLVSQGIRRNEEGETTLQQALEQAVQLAQYLVETEGYGKEIAQRSSGITEFIRQVRDISDNTSLLAMNAAIEAAHAGKAGEGFAIVADQIRTLSQNTQKALSGIEQLTKEIMHAISLDVQLAQRGSAAAQAMRSKAEAAKNAVSTQKAFMSNIAAQLSQLSHTISKQALSLQNLQAQSTNLEGDFDSLIHHLGTNSQSVRAISAALGKLKDTTRLNRETSTTLSNFAQNLERQASDLSQLVGEFKTD